MFDKLDDLLIRFEEVRLAKSNDTAITKRQEVIRISKSNK